MELYNEAIDIATNPKHARWLSPLFLATDAFLCAAIILRIPYTEIDWKAYMQQVAQYRSGERDYALVKGDTGPLVYPAAHVYTYNALYNITNGGTDIFRAQYIFAGLYMSTLSVVMACYQNAKAPPYIFPLLILSKRLHSLFLLRLFNDCFAALALFTAIYFYQRRIFTVGSVAFAFGVGIKMSLLLAAPAVGIILLQALPFKNAINSVFLMAQIQFTLSLPFLLENWLAYLTRSFQLNRVFLYKWTVNWRFIGEKQFLSSEFAIILLCLHAIVTAIFLLSRWTRPSGLTLPALLKTIFRPRPPLIQQRMSLNVSPDFTMTAILTSQIIGLLYARSLHYQFYAYLAWATPFLLWKSRMHPALIYAVWTAQEWAWNVYPSTNLSSQVVVGCLAIQVIGVWVGTSGEYADVTPTSEIEEHKNGHIE